MTEWHEVQKRILKEKNLIKDKFSNRRSKFSYILPVPKEKIKRVIVSSISHVENLCNAIDFLVLQKKGIKILFCFWEG